MMRAVLDASRDNSSPVWGRLGGDGLVVTEILCFHILGHALALHFKAVTEILSAPLASRYAHRPMLSWHKIHRTG